METNLPGQNEVEQSAAQSQTGSPQKPIQVENIQYNVNVGKYSSRVGLAFTTSSISLIFIVLVLAWVLHGIAGQMFGFGKDALGGRITLLIALSIPLIPLHIFSSQRLKKLIANPVNLEDIIFKKRLRKALWLEIVIGVFYVSSGIYRGLNITFLNKTGNAAEAFSSAIFYGGAFVLLALWSYSFQKQTQR